MSSVKSKNNGLQSPVRKQNHLKASPSRKIERESEFGHNFKPN